MPHVLSPQRWVALDLDDVRAWAQDRDGNDVRRPNRAAAIVALGTVMLHHLGRRRLQSFNQVQHPDNVEASGANPLYQWRLFDTYDNGRKRIVRALVGLPTTGTGDGYMQREDGAGSLDAASISGKIALPAGTLTWPSSLFEIAFIYDRGAASGAVDAEGLASFPGAAAGLRVYDAVCYDLPNDKLDTQDGPDAASYPNGHRYVDIDGVATGRVVLADVLEDIRADLDHERRENLPKAFEWHAAGTSAGWAQPTASGPTAIYTAATAFENVLDTSVAARSAASPGFVCHFYRAGIGPEDEDEGKKIKVECWIYGTATTHDAEVKIIGPDHIASNETTITITAGAGPGWYGGSSHVIYLNSAAVDTAPGTDRNKVDVHFRTTTSGGTAWIYSIDGLVDA